MRTFKITTEFTFTGVFKVKAENRLEATDAVEKHCGLSIGNVHSTLPDEDIDWDFDMTPKKKITKINPSTNQQEKIKP